MCATWSELPSYLSNILRRDKKVLLIRNRISVFIELSLFLSSSLIMFLNSAEYIHHKGKVKEKIINKKVRYKERD